MSLNAALLTRLAVCRHIDMSSLSVVVPVYNAECYLEPLLHSVAGQSVGDLDVVMVDDGSTDGSRTIAEEFVRKDSRFRLFVQANGGSGSARNAGIAHATGDFLAFADCDDIVADGAYRRLIDSLEQSGSVIACGGVRRFNSVRNWPSPLHKGIFDISRQGTHITAFRPLLGDRTIWNKVYERAFWDSHHLRFPLHPFEDGCLTVRAHVLAPAVDVVAEPIYYWRDRDEGPPSTVQQTSDAKLLRGRMKQVWSIAEFLTEQAAPLATEYHRVALEHDVMILLTALPGAGVEIQSEILEFAATFLENVHESVVEQLSAMNQSCYRLVRDRDVSRLLDHLAERPEVQFL